MVLKHLILLQVCRVHSHYNARTSGCEVKRHGSLADSQIQALLRHKSWDARVAAGECLGLIAEQAAHPSPADLASAAAGSAAGSGKTLIPRPAPLEAPKAPASVAVARAEDGALTLTGFDLARVLERGTQLLASGGQVRADSHAGTPWIS